jgi:hypothetical protein
VIEMGDRPMSIYCPKCDFIFPDDLMRWNNKNRERHIETCTSSSVRGLQSISSLFSPASKRKLSELDEPVVNHASNTRTNESINSIDDLKFANDKSVSPRKRICSYKSCIGFKPFENMRKFPLHLLGHDEFCSGFDYFNNALHHKSCITMKCIVMNQNSSKTDINQACEK